MRNEGGVTLIELMVGMFVALIVVAAGFTMLVGANKAVRVNDQTTDMQQNVRVAMQLLSRDIKMAGFGMVGQVGACAVGVNPAPLVPRDQTPTGPDQGPDVISLVVPTSSSVTPLWRLAAAVGPGFNEVTLQAGAVADMQTMGLAVGSTISLNGALTATVSAVNAGANSVTLTNNVAAPASFPVGTTVHLLQCVTYQVILPPDNNGVCLGSAPCLVRGVTAALNCDVAGSPCLPIVDGVEDLQFAYACDGCNAAVNGGVADKEIDDQNGSNTFDQGDFITNSTWTTAPLLPNAIRLVQINIVARQTSADQGLGESQAAMTATAGPEVISDHNPALDVGYNASTYSRLRRRILTTTVETRNLGLS